MKELSLNILDITENSVKAGATLTEILIEEITERVVTLRRVRPTAITSARDLQRSSMRLS